MSRKKWLYIKLILLILILITLGRISVFVMSSSSLRSSHFGGTIMKNVPLIEGEKKSFSNIETIVVDAISLPVHIYESDVTQVTIQDNSAVYGLGTKIPNTLTQKDGVLSFKQGKQFSFLSLVNGNIIIEVPKGSLLEYDIRNISGNILIDATSKDTLTATTISGSVKIQQGGENVFAKSTSGSITIYSAFEEVNASSVSGSIRILANQDSKQISGSSVSGSVKIQLENVTGYHMNYSTTSSTVKDTYTNTDYSKSGNASFGDASLKINASSVSGSIKLTDWE